VKKQTLSKASFLLRLPMFSASTGKITVC